MSGHSIMGGAYFQIVVSQNSSIQSRCVIWDPFSSDLGSICDTICLQTRVSLDPKTQCGWQSTEKKAERISFTHKNTTTTTSTMYYLLLRSMYYTDCGHSVKKYQNMFLFEREYLIKVMISLVSFCLTCQQINEFVFDVRAFIICHL